MAKDLEDKIKKMREDGHTLKSIAEAYGVSITTVDNVVNPHRREDRQRRSMKYYQENKEFIKVKRREYNKEWIRKYRLSKKKQLMEKEWEDANLLFNTALLRWYVGVKDGSTYKQVSPMYSSDAWAKRWAEKNKYKIQ